MDEERTCRYCKHYRQYYTKNAAGRFMPLHIGHCVKPRLKRREADSEGCQYWQGREEKA